MGARWLPLFFAMHAPVGAGLARDADNSVCQVHLSDPIAASPRLDSSHISDHKTVGAVEPWRGCDGVGTANTNAGLCKINNISPKDFPLPLRLTDQPPSTSKAV